MDIMDKQFKAFLEKLPNTLQDSIENAIDFSTPDTSAIDDDFLTELYKLDPRIYEKIKQGLEQMDDQPEETLKFKFLNRYSKNVEPLNGQEEEDIIIWEGNYETDRNVRIEYSKIVIIDGNLTCNNLIVDDAYLFVNGNVNCNILFAASGNDKMTHIALDIHANAIVENGHYTLVEGEICSESIIMIHNEIRSNKAVKANVIFKAGVESGKTLNSAITDDKGYFDETKFTDLLASQKVFNLFM